MMSLHVRMPTGTRVEHTEFVVDNIERTIRTVVPADELLGISDNIGLPLSYDLAFYQTDTIGPQDADLLIQLKPGHKPTASTKRKFAICSCASIQTSQPIFRPPISSARC